ncbi:putative zinc finger in N-recognin-domain-containing protein [Microdochium trichocladiopsis]|uniref:Zinc finger in N-recognin-domain-containing protein n=1 Tax=Microdochium trichocladiopsis TaxID=1682393 RepID=A0A9P8Y5E3_9PEZI|nr:putative zinc finger in N-recognin-domain-containing protein [Microdochium trichocladiopsis]KAH7030656.1 putative zinc finger in N-recognin-domain-containing protein [Microdochium trichocladiopsis]
MADEPTASAAQSNGPPPKTRSDSFTSQQSTDSQTAADFIRSQMQLEADAREAMPYSIDNCTKPLGSLRQNVFACLTCNPPPAAPSDHFAPAGICYSCSVQCHGEHELVEIFQKRNFTCDCGTTRFRPDQPCTIRVDPATNTKGNVHSEEPAADNKYNHNFRNLFCSCAVDYKPQEQKGTMFQCLGLGTVETGGCGEDWCHPGCLVGLGPKWYESMTPAKKETEAAPKTNLESIAEDGQPTAAPQVAQDEEEDDDNDVPLPDGFPAEDEFEHLICHKCVEANPWIKRYAGTDGFLPPVYLSKDSAATTATAATSQKRKHDADDDSEPERSTVAAKRLKQDPEPEPATAEPSESEAKPDPSETVTISSCKLEALPPQHPGVYSLFVKPNFREQFCRCPSCFPQLSAHPQLLEEEEAYEPPLTDGENSEAGGSGGSANSLLERGESALKNVDRVRAIEGVMAYNHLKEQLKPFFQQFAESGQAISAEDIKGYFAKLRGDEAGIKQAGEDAAARGSGAGGGSGGSGGNDRKEQSGY